MAFGSLSCEGASISGVEATNSSSFQLGNGEVPTISGQAFTKPSCRRSLSRALLDAALSKHNDANDDDEKGHSIWEDFQEHSPGVIMLPGAWAMGDGLVLETDVPVARHNRSSSVASYAESTQSFSESVFRMAGSFTAGMSSYIADLASAWASTSPSEGLTEDENDDDNDSSWENVGADFASGSLAVTPRLNSFTQRRPSSCPQPQAKAYPRLAKGPASSHKKRD
ncbi:hypothetical protein Agub_g6906 [Astrephomene gubernaculifera]|uniref:Uncharacterized protein n=1 Tax=Astrephomene gubernaculifera TaxID=47775 RepID=A0AAD3HM91_9CHLO|nr:hypothetical protein Agub_g6906 [Astrephomene gubernaculifera]